MVKKNGTNGPDTFNGTIFNDQYNGLGGNDRIDGNAGNDRLHGGLGDDKIMGGSGNDRIWGDDGNDSIIGGANDDRIDGGAGNDTIDGAKDNDMIIGGTGVDTMTGGSGADQFYFKAGETGDVFAGAADVITDFNGAEGDRIRLRGVSTFDGNDSSPLEDHYGIWKDPTFGWVVTYKDNGTYHDIVVGLQNPTGYVFSF